MDEQSFRVFYDQTARPLRAYLVSAAGNQALADDLMQEAYFRLLRSGFTTDDDRHRKNYLFRIATNLIRDHFRRRRPLVSSESAPEAVADSAQRLDERVHQQRDFARVMGELKMREQQLLWLAYVEGSSHSEIATVLGLKATSIRSMLFRARRRLAELLRSRDLAPGAREAGS